MFDAQTAALIAAAPALDGLDLDTLPQRLTEAYTNIVVARMRLREAGGGQINLPEATAPIIKEMRRLAFTQEAFVAALPDRQDRAAAAFVAGAAHHVSLLADRLTHVLELWVAGNTLETLEVALGTRAERIGNAEKARQFVLRAIPDLSYAYGLTARVAHELAREQGEDSTFAADRDWLASSVRYGLEVPEQVALRALLTGVITRRAVHRRYLAIQPFLDAAPPGESRADLMSRVRRAIEAAARDL
jgi:hypothetical protein